MNISRQNYYKYRNTVDKDYGDYLLIKEVFDEGKKMYGARRIQIGLINKHGLYMNLKKVRRIMTKYDIKVRYYKKLKNNKIKQIISENVKENLLKRDFTSKALNEKWVADITYIIYKGKKVYLSSIMDLYSRDVIAYKISNRMTTDIVVDVLNEALSKQKDVTGLILHSDRGFQYTSYEYKAICEANGIKISMSPKGSPVDNSPIESYHSSLKRETLYSYNITSLKEYITLVEEWLLFYNTSRIRLKQKNT